MYKILIVDDEFEMRHGLLTYFPWGDIGFDVCATVEDGRQALEYLKSHQGVDVQRREPHPTDSSLIGRGEVR